MKSRKMAKVRRDMSLLVCTFNVMWCIMGEQTGTTNIRTALRSGMSLENGNHVG